MTRTGIDYENSQVILIGTTTYEGSKRDDVPAVRHSLRGMYAMLTHPRYGGWPKDRIALWVNQRNAGDLSRRLREVARSTTGVLIVYFAGHGVLTAERQLCLMLPDTTLEDADLSGLELRQVSRAFEASEALTKILILDCCYANQAIGHLAADAPVLDSSPGTYTLTATNPLQEEARWSGHNDGTPTSFTGELLDLIRVGRPGGPERLSLNDLYPSLRKRLISLDLPRPYNDATDMATHQPFTLNAAYPSLDGEDIVPASFGLTARDASPRWATRLPRPLRTVAGQAAAIGQAVIQSASWRLISVPPRTRRRAVTAGAALCLAAAVLAGYLLSTWTGEPAAVVAAPPTVSPTLHLEPVYQRDAGKGSSSYAFLPNDYAVQAFRCSEPYIDKAAVIVGLDMRIARSTVHTLEIQILDTNGKVLGDQFAALVDNGQTTVVFPDIRATPGGIYRLRAWNRSEDILGIYLNSPTSASANVGPASIEGQPPESGIISGYVEGRNLPTTNALMGD